MGKRPQPQPSYLVLNDFSMASLATKHFAMKCEGKVKNKATHFAQKMTENSIAMLAAMLMGDKCYYDHILVYIKWNASDL